MNREHSGKKISPATPPSEAPTPSPVEEPKVESPKPEEKRVVTDHRDSEELKELSLELKGRFTSKYDRMMSEEKRRVNKKQAENRREIQQQLHKPPPVFLSDKNQQFILSLLEDKHFSLQDYDTQHLMSEADSRDPKTPNDSSSSADTGKASLRKQMLELGFPAGCLDACLAACGSLAACIDWCCLHLKDQELPAQFRAAGKQLEVKFARRGDSARQRLAAFGFDSAELDSVPDFESLEAALSTLLPRLLPSFRLTTATTLDEETEDELAALQSIFGEELAVETLGALRLCSLQAASAQGPVLVALCLAPRFGYPQQAPIALIDGAALSPTLKRAFTRCVFERFTGKGSGVLFEVLSDVDALLLAAAEMPAEMSQSAEKVEKKVEKKATEKGRQQGREKTQTKRRPRAARVLDRATLYGTPSAQVSAQRRALPITAYKEQVLAMVAKHQVCIVSGGTGCGKSTQVPQFLLEQFREGAEKDLNVVVCEPRRISCLGLYNRVMEEQGYKGENSPVGYQVRGDAKCGR